MKASHRSIHPNFPGVPWWAALLIAVGATAVGFAIDAGSGHKELTHVFAGFYIAGCVAAVLAVRQEGVFTAIIQPPLILFCAVPGGYWLFHGRKVGHLKDLLINCGYPLIERFPLMLGTAGGVLLIGLIRWYLGMSHRTTGTTTVPEDGDSATSAQVKSFVSGIVAKLQSALRGDPGEDDPDQATTSDARRTRTARRPANARATTRGGRSATRPTRTQSRRVRPSSEDPDEPRLERPRRPSRGSQTARDVDPADPPRRSRRPRPDADAERGQARRESRTRRGAYEPAPRGSRFDGFDPYQPPADRYAPYEPREGYEPYETRGRRPAARGTNGADPTHHPISRARYRGEAPAGETRTERPSRSRASGRSSGRPSADFWEYDR